MKLHLPTTKLKLAQQLIITFAVIVLVPLLGVSLIIYNINQTALRKELLKFTEHTAETIYKDFTTEMSWQQEQSGMMSYYLLERLGGTKKFDDAARGIFNLSKDFEAIALYDAEGLPLQSAYRDFQKLSPELRLPEQLPKRVLDTRETVYDVVYFDTGDPKESPYYLRAIVPLTHGPTAKAAFYVQLKHFPYLQGLIRAHESIYENFYIIDQNGFIIAGPSQFPELKARRISDEDLAYFKRLQAGVSREFSTREETVSTSRSTAQPDEESDDTPPIQKVFVKMPDIHWGIIIESPYHVRQKYIKRANEQSLVLIIVCLALVILLGLVYVLGITRNFRQLIKGIKAMAEGNYFRRIRLITNFFTPHEIIYLTGEFNRMAKRRAEAWEELEEANQKLAKLDEFKSNLIDTVSHELRTPLTSIKGYTSRLLRYDDTLDKESRIKSLKVVKQQADRLGRLVEDLLVIPDLEKANLRVFPDQVDLPELIDRSVQFIQAKDQRDVQVSYHPPLGEQLAVLADPDRLEQILLNLLDNAVKYSTPDTPLRVDVMPAPEAPDMIEVRVINASDPIPEAALEKLFDKFQRMDDSTIRTTRGSGLGLFITRGLVEAMGGVITLAYQGGEFSVRFTLPLYRAMSVPETAV